MCIRDSLHGFSFMDFILAEHFEWLSDAGAANFELEIFSIAVKAIFNKACLLYTSRCV